MSDLLAINSDSYEHFCNGCDMIMSGGTNETGTITDGNWWKKYLIGLNKVILLKIELMMHIIELL